MGLTRTLDWIGLRTAREPLPNIGNVVPTKRADVRPGTARDHADVVAEHFLRWLLNDHPTGCWTSTDLYDTAQWSFCDAVGVTPPPERSLLAAIKRIGGINHRQDCRLLDADGHAIKKATLWSFGHVQGKIWVGNLTRP